MSNRNIKIPLKILRKIASFLPINAKINSATNATGRAKIPNEKVKAIAKKNIEDIKNSNRRDFRF